MDIQSRLLLVHTIIQVTFNPTTSLFFIPYLKCTMLQGSVKAQWVSREQPTMKCLHNNGKSLNHKIITLYRHITIWLSPFITWIDCRYKQICLKPDDWQIKCKCISDKIAKYSGKSWLQLWDSVQITLSVSPVSQKYLPAKLTYKLTPTASNCCPWQEEPATLRYHSVIPGPIFSWALSSLQLLTGLFKRGQKTASCHTWILLCY